MKQLTNFPLLKQNEIAKIIINCSTKYIQAPISKDSHCRNDDIAILNIGHDKILPLPLKLINGM